MLGKYGPIRLFMAQYDHLYSSMTNYGHMVNIAESGMFD